MAENELKLKVAEAVQDDVAKGIVRIDSTLMKQIGISPGDIVEIEGKRKTAAVADRSYPGDLGLSIIRMDGISRRNSQTSIGEEVAVRKADVKEAKKVTIAPARKGIIIKASPQLFKQGLLGHVVVKGDIVSLGGTRRRRTAMSGNPFFDELNVFNVIDESLGFGFSDIKFIVVNTNPVKSAVIITDETEVEFNPEAVEVKEEAVIEVSYEDIGGLKEEVTKIREMVELPLKHPEIFERLGIEPPKGVLLHGPPGTGKTLLAKAVASETNSHFILINGPEIISKYYGASEENLRKKFEEASKNAPSIIFIDEIDAIASKREETRGEVERRVVAQLLGLMDGLQSRGKVIVLAATNRPNALDPALRRPGRFDRELEIGVPSKQGRLDVLKIHTRNMPMDHWDEQIAGNKLMAQLDKRIKKLNADAEEKNNRIKELQLQQAEKQDLFDKNIKELKLSEAEEKKGKTELDLKRILSKIGIMRSETEELKSKLSELNENLAEDKKIVEKIVKEADAITKDRDELHGQKRTLKAIVEEIKETKYIMKVRDINDIRAVFSERILLSKSEKIRSIMKDLLDYGVISNDFLTEIRIASISKMLEDIADITYGFVGADLSALTKETALVVLRRVLPDLKLDQEEPIPKEILEDMNITMNDFKDALKIVRPSAMREVLVEVPNVKWEDIGGLDKVKKKLMEAVDWPLKQPEVFSRMGIRPPKGILLYGAPGTGKTMLAKAVATESKANFILVNGPSLLSKWVGESEKAVREIFRKARQTAPTIIFFDEVDSLAPRRGRGVDDPVSERVVNQILTEMDGLQELNDVVVLAATNRPDMVDTALLRPGRFDRIIQTTVPDKTTREKIFEVHINGMPVDKSVSIPELAEKTAGYVGADIEAVCREAAMLALRENINAKVITKKHFIDCIEKEVSPSITSKIEEKYQKLEKEIKRTRAQEMLDKEEKPNYVG